MTKQEKRHGKLVQRGYFKSECKAWSAFDWKDAPWWPSLRRKRTALVRQWAKKTGRSLATTTPEEIKRSLIYQQLVRKWYKDQGWFKETVRQGRKTFRIDAYAAMRWYSDNYQKSPEGKEKYMPPWRKRQKTRREREAAIDARFDSAVGIIGR